VSDEKLQTFNVGQLKVLQWHNCTYHNS